ncbi:sorting nexin-16 [Carassius auratus]|uniref:Sorting nexin-16 n=1 Tax=Carassius auratus TaxID=7957 RepID=A0A6P6JT87_CARAU|nr:sorting nexin-16-like [Carassius auratus]
MFYQNLSPDVVRKGNAMEYYSNGFCRESSEERTLKVTLLGYKVMEEKTKFTVYKILVKRAPEESWHIFRRYTDFSRLHDKLKEAFPSFNFTLPPKRWFKNFSAEFLEERQLGLQNFLQSLSAHKEVRISEAVREFLCLDDPPTAFDDIRERWAFCETPGGTSGCLQRDLMDEERETESLRNVLLHKELQISQPERTKNGMYRTQEKLNREPRDVLTAQEYKEVERDALRRPNKCSELGFIRTHGACWCGSANESPEKHSSKKPIK